MISTAGFVPPDTFTVSTSTLPNEPVEVDEPLINVPEPSEKL